MFAMENKNSYEKLSIRDSAKALKKYGSTNRHVMRNDNYIKHSVTSSDTLQGIALRYGVTMEQIRRANRLWASDSLFLREHLLIPSGDAQATPLSNNSANTPTTPSTSQATNLDTFEEDANDFLEKIDASIASTKEEVRKAQGNSDFTENLNYPVERERKKPATSRMKKSMNNNTSDLFSAPQTIVMTQGNKIKTSMKRYERQQDELFEL